MKKIVLIALLTLIGSACFAQQKQFTVFEAVSGFTHKPNLSVDGLKNVRLFYQGSLMDGTKVDEQKLEKWAIATRNAGSTMVCNFIDPWFIKKNFTEDEAAEIISKINAKFHEYCPKAQVSTYGLPVMVNLNLGMYRAVQSGTEDTYLSSWRSTNAFLVKASNVSDVLYPSLYAVDNDLEAWTENLKATVEYCHEVCPGKPVYPFIQMQYYNEKGSDLALEYIDAKFWAGMLEALYKYADGVVIYSVGRDVDNQTKVDWEDDRVQNIYNATLKFMKKYKVNKPVKK